MFFIVKIQIENLLEVVETEIREVWKNI
jgi:hypothetical protein